MKTTDYAKRIRSTGTQVVKAPNGTGSPKKGQVKTGSLRDGGKK